MNHYYPSRDVRQVNYPRRSPYEMARIGAIAGLCGAGARNIYRLRNDEIDRAQAVVNTLKGSATAGLAAGAASLVAGQFRTPLISTLAGIAAGTAVIYGLERVMVRGEEA
ncbi:MAG: hypothetical protein ACLFSC_11245 [Wenzhouxiangella sp.]